MTERSDDVHKELPVKLTEAELLKFGDQAADCEMRIAALKLERKTINGHISDQRDERKRVLTLIEDGSEARKVLCRWVESIAENCKRLIRQDTGDEVDLLPLTASDRQMDLESPLPAGDETIDLEDVPDDDAEPDDEDTEDTESEQSAEPEPPAAVAKGRRRSAQRHQASA